MAPYISSHLHDKVWMAPPCQVPSLDILQNLVANTRSKQSAAHMALLAPRVTGSASSGLHPAAEKTSAWIGQCVVADSGWSLCGQLHWRDGGFQATALLDHTNF